MIDDAKDEYNIQYYANWEVFMGIVFFMGISVKLLSKSSTTTPITK
jgi:hypothetical protein